MDSVVDYGMEPLRHSHLLEVYLAMISLCGLQITTEGGTHLGFYLVFTVLE